MTPEELARRSVDTMLERDRFSAWLGLQVTELAPGKAAVQMTVREEMANGFGVCHGGVTFALADSALAFASNTGGVVTLSIDNAISYAAPARPGDVLIARAERESEGEKIGFYRVTVARSGGDVVALFRGTTYRTKDKLPVEGR